MVPNGIQKKSKALGDPDYLNYRGGVRLLELNHLRLCQNCAKTLVL